MPPRGATSSKRAPAIAAEQQVRLGIGIGGERLGLEPDAAVRLVQVEPAVVVEVEHRHAEARETPAGHAQSGRYRRVHEEAALVAVERVGLGVQVHHDQVVVAVIVHVGRVHAHAGLRRAVLIDGHAAQQRRLGEAPVSEIDPEMVRRAVVGDEDVHAPVTVHVVGDDAEAVADGRAQCRRPGRCR